MAFVNELIPEEQKAKFDPDVFVPVWSPRGTPLDAVRWAVDRERDVFLVRLGAVPVGPEVIALSYKGEVIKVVARYSETGKWLDGNLVGNWVVEELHTEELGTPLPPVPEAQRHEMVELIREGLEAMGNPVCDTKYLSKVNIDFQVQK